MGNDNGGRKKGRLQRLRRFIFKTGLIVFALLVVLEIILRWVGGIYQARYLEERDQRREARTRVAATVLALGESTTGGLWLPFEESYPKQLEHKLRETYGHRSIEVVVPPHSGQNTSQMEHRIAEYLRDFEPKAVIFMAGVNNTWSLAESNLGDFLPPGSLRTYLFRLRQTTDDVKVVRMMRLAASSTSEAWTRFQDESAGAPPMTQWPPPPDRLVRGIGPEAFAQLWRSDLGKMIAASKEAGANVILMTYPNYDTPTPEEFRALAEHWSVPLIENHKSFLPYLEQNRASEVFFEDIRHPNAVGYGIVADNVLKVIVEGNLLAGAPKQEPAQASEDTPTSVP